jgi:hypothetical protein
MMAQPERLYPIKPDEGHFFYAGIIPGEQQVLMGLFCPDLVAFCFDAAGNLLCVHSRPLPFLRRSDVLVDGQSIEGLVRPYDIYDERIPQQLDAWQRELQFQPQTIRVKKFSLPELGIRIEDYPDYFDEVFADPRADQEEKDHVRAFQREWEAARQFVLWWGNDYWLDDTGEVVAS